jgi:hypothetical protein
MKTIADRSFLAQAARSFAALIALFLFFLAPLYAQMTPTDCPVGGGGSRGSGADIQCRLNNVLNQNQALLTTISNNTPACSASDARCKSVKDSVTEAQNAGKRAMKANARLKPDDFGDLNTVRKEKCQSPKKSDCASGNGMYSGGDSDTTVGMDMADHLDEATTALSDANDAVNEANSSTPSMVQQMEATMPPSTFEPLYDFESDPDYPHYLHPFNNPEAQWLTGTRYAVMLAATTLKAVHDITEDECKQEVVVAGEGGNTSTACVILTGALAVAEAYDKRIEFHDSNQLGWEVHGIYQREENLNNNVGQVDRDVAAVSATAGNTQTEITQLQGDIAALQTSVNALQEQLAHDTFVLSQKLYVNNDFDKQLLKLLLVPDGNRSLPASLLNCTGDSSTSRPCPAVNIQCSLKTNVCSFSAH